MATLTEIKQAYMDTLGYVPRRLVGVVDDGSDQGSTEAIYEVYGEGSGFTQEYQPPTAIGPQGLLATKTPTLPTPVSIPTTTTTGPATIYSPTTGSQYYSAPVTPIAPQTAENAALYLPSWLKGTALEQVWIDRWTETGDGDLAIQAVREAPAYDTLFPGNRREDGSLRYDEDTYFGLLESYSDTLLSVNVNPDLYQDKFIDMIEGLVSPTEFATRVNSMYERVLTASDAIQTAYAEEFGFDMSLEGIVASFLDPDVGQSILNRQISLAEVMGEASSRQFTVGRDLAEQYVNFGVDTVAEAQGYFAEAEAMIPTLSVLATRHADPDDDFDLTEFTNATLFGDPAQRRRMRRLMAQERADFGADRSLTIRQGRPGALTGLGER